MARALPILALLLVALTGLVGAAFVVQNSLRTVTLSLNLGVAAWQYPPMSVMALAGGAFGVGLLLGALVLVWWNWGLRKQVRDLQRQLAMADAGGGF